MASFTAMNREVEVIERTLANWQEHRSAMWIRWSLWSNDWVPVNKTHIIVLKHTRSTLVKVTENVRGMLHTSPLLYSIPLGCAHVSKENISKLMASKTTSRSQGN